MMYAASSMRRFFAVIAILLLGTVGCDDATAPRERVEVVTIAQEQRIVITNRTRQRIFTFVIGRNAAAVVDWVQCVSECPPLAPNASRSVPYPVPLVEPETEAVVYWWFGVRGLDGVLRPGSLRSRIVKL